MMDWNLCRTFLAVADAGSYLGAARLLRTSHPTVGRAVAALEGQLGTKLFARSTEGLALTEQGRVFRTHVQAMATAALRAEAAVSARGARARGTVRLSIGPTLAAYWLMPRMDAFLQQHAEIEIDLVTHPFPASVLKRDADIVLRVFQSGDENLVGRKIARLGAGFYASRDYVARFGLPERKDDWKSHRVVGFDDKGSNADLGRWSDHVVRDAALVMRCSSQADMLAAVRAGIGICVLSCIVGDAYADLVRVLPHKLVSNSDVWLLAHPDLVDLPPVRAVMDFVTEAARLDRDRLRGR